MNISHFIKYSVVASATLGAVTAIVACAGGPGPGSGIAAAGGMNPGAGGVPPAAGGVPPAAGGAQSTGGVMATGGVQGVGGSVGSGGTPPASGGTDPGAGGTGTVNCTDDQHPDHVGAPCSQWPEWDATKAAGEPKDCDADWLTGAGYCLASCGKCDAGGSGGSTGSGGSASGGSSSSGGSGSGGFSGTGGQPPAIPNGTSGWATRYWDCCKPACGWDANFPGPGAVHSCNQQNQSLGGDYNVQNACEGNSNGAYMCQDFGPWAVSNTLSYGFAATNIGGSCGKCYQLEFTGSSQNAGNDPGSQSLSGKTMIVQAINNGGLQPTQWDILIPGGGVGDFNACSTQWGVSNDELGAQYGGFLLTCKQQNNSNYDASKSCAAQKCQQVFGNKPDLLASCNWFINWYGAADNPNLRWQQIACPAGITQKSGISQ